MSLAYVLACAKSLLKSNGAFFEGNTGTWSGGNFIVAIDGIAFNENITMDSYVLWRIGVATGLDTTGPSLFNPLGTCRAISEADAERLNNAPYPYPKGTCRAVKDSCVSRGGRGRSSSDGTQSRERRTTTLSKRAGARGHQSIIEQSTYSPSQYLTPIRMYKSVYMSSVYSVYVYVYVFQAGQGGNEAR